MFGLRYSRAGYGEPRLTAISRHLPHDGPPLRKCVQQGQQFGRKAAGRNPRRPLGKNTQLPHQDECRGDRAEFRPQFFRKSRGTMRAPVIAMSRSAREAAPNRLVKSPRRSCYRVRCVVATLHELRSLSQDTQEDRLQNLVVKIEDRADS